ncbi:MAG: hypothetical protein ACYTDY_15215 [Planctomycetota bacterium]|jgi:hypothetical protein
MSIPRRIAAVALLRSREATRGPLTAFLVVFVLAAAAVALLTPGEPGPDRQRAVDGFVFDIGLLVTVLAAAAIGSASFAADRETGRGVLLHATPLRTAELVIGGALGHAACLLVLVLGAAAGFLAVTGLLAGGDADRSTTRRPIRAVRLLDERGREVAGIKLRGENLAATYMLDVAREDLGVEDGAPARVLIQLEEYVDDMGGGIPAVYPVSIRVGDGPDRVIRQRVDNPLEIELTADSLLPEGMTPISVRRVDPAYTLGLGLGGFVAQGHRRSFPMNVAKAFLAWFFGLLVIASAASALSTLVGAPVANAGALLLVLLGRSLGILSETAAFLARSEESLARTGAGVLRSMVDVLPDFGAYDLGLQLTTRWDIDAATISGRLGSAAAEVGVLLLLALALLVLRRRA